RRYSSTSPAERSVAGEVAAEGDGRGQALRDASAGPLATKSMTLLGRAAASRTSRVSTRRNVERQGLRSGQASAASPLDLHTPGVQPGPELQGARVCCSEVPPARSPACSLRTRLCSTDMPPALKPARTLRAGRLCCWLKPAACSPARTF